MKSLPERIMEHAEAAPEATPICPAALLHLGKRGAVNQALSRLARSGRLMRICQGVYMRPIQTRFGRCAPGIHKSLQALSELWGETIVPNGGGAANWLGLTTQNPIRSVYLTNSAGRYRSVARWRKRQTWASRVASKRTSAIFDRSTCDPKKEAMKSTAHYPELIDGDRVPYCEPPASTYARVMRGHETDSDDHSYCVAWKPSLCTNLRRTRHGPALKKRFAALAFGQTDKKSGIRRLHPHRPSATIRAGTTRDRGSWSAPPLHPYQHRVLTTRECARLQSFPGWFLFHPVKWQGNRQVGNAVPPLLARAIGGHVLRTLGISILTESAPIVERNDSLVAQDIAKARASGLSRRKVSQQVVHPQRPQEAAR